ncbi:MAG: sterol desaturase family protein [Aureispira sp.]|nr:sterol desaturase family protein [Aureispira sp.]
MNIMLFAIPVFFLLIGLELLVAKLQNTQLYRVNDAITNISCGIVQQVTGAFTKLIGLAAYAFVYYNWRFFDIPNVWWTYILLFLAVDCLYYWFHRYAHEISAFWGTHVVHHQSEDYNLSVALRQSAFQSLISAVFYLPLAFLGFDPIPFLTINILQTLYQFWIHTETIDKMPKWFEFIFSTPSHHRVHHGRNPQYIDKNHGGTLIIFDRLFGTFEPEVEPVVYGVTKSLESCSPIWANFDYYNDLSKEMSNTPGVGNKLRMLIEKPGWRPQETGGYQAPPPISRAEVTKYNPSIPLGLNYYILFQYVVVLLGTTGFLASIKGDNLLTLGTISLATLVILSVSSLGAILDKRQWAPVSEILRLIGIPILLWLIFPASQFILITTLVMAGIGLLSIIWFLQYRKTFSSTHLAMDRVLDAN